MASFQLQFKLSQNWFQFSHLDPWNYLRKQSRRFWMDGNSRKLFSLTWSTLFLKWGNAQTLIQSIKSSESQPTPPWDKPLNFSSPVMKLFALFSLSWSTTLPLNHKFWKEFLQVDEVLSKNGNKKINAETVAEMPYLTACLTETMRMEPGFFRSDRKCTKDWEYEGIKIKKG